MHAFLLVEKLIIQSECLISEHSINFFIGTGPGAHSFHGTPFLLLEAKIGDYVEAFSMVG